MLWQLKRTVNIIKKDGFSTWFSATRQYLKDKSNPISPPNMIFNKIPLSHFEYITNFKKHEKKPFLSKPNKGESFTINWIIPSFGLGSGGHLNIFRYIKLLEGHGHFNRIYIFGSSSFHSDEEAKRFLNRNFFHLEAEVYNSIDDIQDSDAIFATSWQTAYAVNTMGNTSKKFYFIQDYEPYFYPVGSEYLFAQQTYFLDFHRVTMGPWIAEHLQKTFGLKSDYLDFGHDPSIYHKKNSGRSSNRHIFFYSRPATTRRCFELGLEAFKELHRRGIEFNLYTAGQEIQNHEIPFPYHGLGILTAYELAELYSNTDLGIVFSPTNTSLLPFEMMACGCPVIELNSESNKVTFPNSEIIELTDSHPIAIADSIEKLLFDEKKRKSQVQKAYEFIKPLTWENSAKNLDELLRKNLTS